MIKLNLYDKLENNPKIEKIYIGISHAVFKEITDKQLTITVNYNGEKIYLNNIDSIKEFLLSKDFYNYKFNNTSFFEKFNDFDGRTKLSKLLTLSGKAECLKGYLEEIAKLQTYPDHNDKLTKDNKDIILRHCFPEYQQFGLLENVFNYSKLGSQNRNDILVEMNVNVCPYCNVNYTINYATQNHMHSTADVDHFYIKSKNPEYSLCLYNFVPSCPICNSRFKNSKSVTKDSHIYPYEESFHNRADFHVDNIIETVINNEQPLVKLNIYDDTKNKIENSTELFKINSIYEQHTWVVKELIDKSVSYHELYQNEIQQLLNRMAGKEFDIKGLVFGKELTEQDYLNVSLGKLKMDILKQLNIYNK